MNVIKKYSQNNPQNYNYESFSRRFYNASTRVYNTTKYESRQYPRYAHTLYPSHTESYSFQASTQVNLPEVSPNSIQSLTSPKSITTEATNEKHDSIL